MAIQAITQTKVWAHSITSPYRVTLGSAGVAGFCGSSSKCTVKKQMVRFFCHEVQNIPKWYLYVNIPNENSLFKPSGIKAGIKYVHSNVQSACHYHKINTYRVIRTLLKSRAMEKFILWWQVLTVHYLTQLLNNFRDMKYCFKNIYQNCL